jgi:hypothetical protein
MRIRALLQGLAGLLILFTLARIGFLARFGPPGCLHASLTWQAMGLGLRMDARLAALCLFPMLVLLRVGGGATPRWKRVAGPISLAVNLILCTVLLVIVNIDDQRAKPWAVAFLFTALLDWRVFRSQGLAQPRIRSLWQGYYVLLLSAIALAFFVDLGAYAYTHTRLNGNLLQFLGNPWLSLRMIWETYPVVWGALALGVWAFLVARGLGWFWRRLASEATLPRVRRMVLGTAATFGVLFLLWGRFNGYPLRWGDAYSLGQSFQAHLALNPVLFLLETVEDPSSGYDLAEVKATGPLLAQYLGCRYEEVQGEPRLWRIQEPHPLVPEGARPNVVLIHLESLAAHKTGILGNALNPTPEFDHLAAQGILFDHFYAPAENTSRAMFAALFGTADMSPGGRNTATRNPLLVEQRSLVNDLEGYSKEYFLGGTGDWAQIRAALKNNLHGLQVKEEDAFKSPKVDVWGVADADFLRECDQFLGQVPEPFFAILQTAGNHPPFTIPPHLGFTQVHPDEAALRAAGFASDQEYNALRLMDWSLGRFMAEARSKPWFAHTIFVLYGDHGVPRGSFDPRFGDLALVSHHVPFLIYAPDLIKPCREHATASLMDLMPTMMSLLGRRVELHTLGRDALAPEFSQKGMAFTFSPFVSPAPFGVLRGDSYLTLHPGTRAQLFSLQDPSGKDLSQIHPEEAHDLEALARAYRAWSRYLLSHNHP